MARRKKPNSKQKQIDAAAARKVLKSLPKKKITNKTIKTGTMVIYKYDAKDKTMIYDKTPCNIVLWRTRTHTLCVALHWAPLGLRESIIDYIYSFNQDNIKNNKQLEITYKKMKPFLRKAGGIPIIRLYINKRMSKYGVIVPSEQMKIAARYSNEDFSVPSPEKLYKKAIYDYKSRRKNKGKIK